MLMVMYMQYHIYIGEWKQTWISELNDNQLDSLNPSYSYIFISIPSIYNNYILILWILPIDFVKQTSPKSSFAFILIDFVNILFFFLTACKYSYIFISLFPFPASII